MIGLGKTVEAERFVRAVHHDLYEHDRGEVIATLVLVSIHWQLFGEYRSDFKLIHSEHS